ncbi:hypothetical protein DNTS_014668 [Danionella cerebrum]|uniref:Lysozyme g n=1 Tax=Danionella cerebrum TaxID=2873325 RepID=A0A553Q1X6_9TELE|nr:hypothetical protein DNTS_014668 [Danionella translucida]TRY83938.1 hypothetical protein DNTS_014668 [Danionella translucida]TRY83939.1 hypothetical protein DNTS_014668 [Danionella translucida]
MGLQTILAMFFLVCIYGDISNIDTTGASEVTAKQDNLTVKGVEASKKLAEHDLARMAQYKSKIFNVARAKQMDPAVIAAIISRESRAGAALKDGWGDHGNGFGLMQVDKRYHKLVGAWDSEEHLTQGTEILISFIKDIRTKFPQWTQDQCFKGGISAYNAGVKNVRTYENMDVGTTGGQHDHPSPLHMKVLSPQGVAPFNSQMTPRKAAAWEGTPERKRQRERCKEHMYLLCGYGKGGIGQIFTQDALTLISGNNGSLLPLLWEQKEVDGGMHTVQEVEQDRVEVMTSVVSEIMSSGSPDITGATEASDAAEECSGKKKSKFQTFKNFFVKKKRKNGLSPAGESGLKASESSEDIASSDPAVSHGRSGSASGSKLNLGNKAMSHDSVFASDSPSSEANEGLGASQDSIHGKMKSLQLQLKQAIRLDSGRKAEEMCHEASWSLSSPQASVPVDFSVPATSASCLDSSAARHRIAVSANARAKRKPVSRPLLLQRREKLLRNMEEESLDECVEQESEGSVKRGLSKLQVILPEQESLTSEHEEDEEAHDSSSGRRSSRSSSISAADIADAQPLGEHHLPTPEVPQCSWERTVTLELQTDDFLLDAGCEVVPDGQGSLLEEVLSSLKCPLASGLTLEPENMLLQNQVEVLNMESMVLESQEQEDEDLLNPSEMMAFSSEQAPPPDSLSDLSLVSDQSTEEEELELPAEESPETSPLQVLEEDAERHKCEEEEEEKLESPVAFGETIEVKVEVESDDVGVEQEKGEESVEEEFEKSDTSSYDEADETVLHSSPETESEESFVDEGNFVEHEPESEHIDREELQSSTETSDDLEAPEPLADELLEASEFQESPMTLPELSTSLEKEQEHEIIMLDVSAEAQEAPAENPEIVSEQQVLESIGSIAEVRPRFTIAPAWQRSLGSGGEQDCLNISPEAGENAASPQSTELITPDREERDEPAPTPSNSSLPVEKEEERSLENPFGVRLRKTPVLHRYGFDGDSSLVQETFEKDQEAKRTFLLKKPEVMMDSLSSDRKTPETVKRLSAGGSESPSWISVARQKQKNFMENSPENSPETACSQGEVTRPDSLLSVSAPVAKEHLTQPHSPLKVFCSLELSNASLVEKDGKRVVNPSALPLAQDEPPWLALAKKKAKAWSEMPQIVQ